DRRCRVRLQSVPHVAVGPALRIQSIVADGRPIDVSAIRDGNRFSRWHSAAAQQGTETVLVDLGLVHHVGCVVLSLGMYVHDYPRSLQIDVSQDGHAWATTWSGRGARYAVAGALDDPGMVPSTFRFPAMPARRVRLRQLGTHPLASWSIAELT